MPLIVGLGNPGQKYAGTRHNIGFSFIDLLADIMSVRMGPGKGPFHVGKARHAGQSLYLVRPTTYINNSGTAVQKALNWYKKEAENCLICYDDLALKLGNIRLRRKGSAGGHNGIKDIIQKLGTDKFPRLRIGIGNSFEMGQQIQYVLSPFNKKEQRIIDETLQVAKDALFAYVEQGIEQAMNDYN